MATKSKWILPSEKIIADVTHQDTEKRIDKAEQDLRDTLDLLEEIAKSGILSFRKEKINNHLKKFQP